LPSIVIRVNTSKTKTSNLTKPLYIQPQYQKGSDSPFHIYALNRKRTWFLRFPARQRFTVSRLASTRTRRERIITHDIFDNKTRSIRSYRPRIQLSKRLTSYKLHTAPYLSASTLTHRKPILTLMECQIYSTSIRKGVIPLPVYAHDRKQTWSLSFLTDKSSWR
jgi:hypothetical protein